MKVSLLGDLILVSLLVREILTRPVQEVNKKKIFLVSLFKVYSNRIFAEKIPVSNGRDMFRNFLRNCHDLRSLSWYNPLQHIMIELRKQKLFGISSCRDGGDTVTSAAVTLWQSGQQHVTRSSHSLLSHLSHLPHCRHPQL